MSVRVEHRTGGSNSWETPQSVFDPLNAEFGFTLDVCASEANAKSDAYFTEADNGLMQDWGPRGTEVC